MRTYEDLRKEWLREMPLDIIALEITGKLLAARDRKGLTQRDLANLSGVPQKTISRIESGKDIPKLPTLIKLAEALDLKLTIMEKTKDELSSTIG